MPSNADINRELDEAYRLLAGGLWVPGSKILSAIQRAVPPGRASRLGVSAYKFRHRCNPAMLERAEEWARQNPSEAINLGRQRRSNRAIESRVLSGAWETRPESIGAAHYRGEAEFVIRDPGQAPGRAGITLAELARQLRTTRNVIHTWVINGLVPEPGAAPRGKGHVLTIPLDHVEIYRKVRELYEPYGTAWYEQARGIWQAPPQVCPHCGGELP